MDTREEWLNSATEGLVGEVLLPAGLAIDGPRRVSCGWPSRGALAATRRKIGQCWAPTASGDGTHELFVSPAIEEPVRVLDILLHEMIHAAIGCDKKHGPAFKRAMLDVGLAGKPTATYAEDGTALHAALADLAGRLGPYPHAKIDYTARPKEGTRLLKAECPECGYTVRVTRKWLDVGLPTCPCGVEMKEAE